MSFISPLYITQNTEGYVTKWGLFYDDSKGHHLISEDFKPVSFATEEEAKVKLYAMEAERRDEDSAIPFSLEEAKQDC